MCKLPVTFGGGMTIAYGVLPLRGSAVKTPSATHCS